MKETVKKLPKWYDGAKYTKGDTVQNPFSGETYELTADELAMYDLIMGINYVGDHRGWDDEMIDTHRKALKWFSENNIKAYMALLD